MTLLVKNFSVPRTHPFVLAMVFVAIVFLANMSFAQNFTTTSTGIPALTTAKAAWVDFNNDNLQDLFIAGVNSTGGLHTAVYLNNGDNTFNVINLTALTDIGFDFNDYNSDGYIDILITGINSSAQKKTILYKNASGAAFLPQAMSLINLSKGGVLWKDLDNDTDADIILTGFNSANEEQTLLYRYDNGVYNAVSHSLPNVSNGELRLIDADNDDQVEVLLTGLKSDGLAISSLYTFHNNFSISEYSNDLPGTAFNAVACGDFNSDGLEDLFISGMEGETLAKKTSVLQNNGANSFIDVATSFIDVSSSSVDVADLNNDGLADVVLSGIDNAGFKYFKYYQNTATFSFIDSAHAMPNIYNGDVALGDYDNDQDLDIFQIGDSDISFQSNLFESDQSSVVTNATPSVPGNLQAIVVNDSVYFSWEAPVDDHTSVNSLTYNLYISRDINGSDLVVTPLSDIVTGYRKAAVTGNAGHKTFKSYNSLAEGRYYWSVQAIDNGLKASAFASEQSFAVCYQLDLGPDTTICYADVIQLSAGEAADEVDWYSKTQGLLLNDDNDFAMAVHANDTIIAHVNKPYNCLIQDTINVKMSAPPVIDLGADTAVCLNEQFSVEVTQSVDSVNWYDPTGAVALNSDSYTYTVSVKDTIVGEFFNEYKCVSYDSIIVDVHSLPLFTIGSDQSICYGESTLLGVTGTWESVTWSSVQNGELASNSPTYLLEVLEKDTIIAQAEDGNGCVGYDSVIVDVLSLPEISLGDDLSICYEQHVNIELIGSGTSIKWFDTKSNLLTTGVSNYTYQVLTQDTTIVEVTDANNCVSYDSIVVHVLPLPYFNVGTDTAVCYGLDILLETGAGFQRVDWLSKMDNEIVNPDSWFFNYTVTETDTLIAKVLHPNGCLNYDSVRIEMLPLPDFTLGPDQYICFRDTAKLEVQGNWDEVNWYTEGDLVLQPANASFEYIVEETMFLWAEVFDQYRCVSYDSININVLSLPEFDLGSDQEYCDGDQIELAVEDVGESYIWKNSDGIILHELREYVFNAESSVKIFLHVTDNFQCHFSDSLQITVYELPEFSVSGNTILCENDTVSLEVEFNNWQAIRWTENDQLLNEGSELEMPFAETALITIRLTDQNLCSSDQQLEITVNERPVANAGSDILMCYGESVVLGSESLSNHTYSWAPVTSLDHAAVSNPSASPVETITYGLTVTNNKNCSSTDSVYVEVNPEIIVDAGPHVDICIGESIVLGGDPTASGSKFEYTYQWMAGDESLEGDTSHIEVKPLSTTTYYVLVTSGKCSVEVDSVHIVVNALPIVTIIGDQSIGAGSSVMLNASGGLEYEWTPAESLSDASSDSPEASPLKTTKYKVVVTDANHCSDTASVDVIVQNNLFIPNTFSPNGDGRNDEFKLYGSGINTFVFTVFDQKGNEVFRTNNKVTAFETGWDGKYNGKVLKDDIYIWTIEGTFYNGEQITYEGKNTGIIKLMK